MNFTEHQGSHKRSHPWWMKFHRITTSGDYIGAVDGVRFLAIMWVILFHLDSYWAPRWGYPSAVEASWIHAFACYGHFGVPLFFVISGFILALPFAKASFAKMEPPRLKAYYLRRVTRLEPPYILAFLLIFCIKTLTYGLLWGQEHLGDLLAGITYTSFIFCPNLNPLFTASWSLEVEVQFYLLLPLFAQVFRLPVVPRRLLIAAAMLLIASLLPVSTSVWESLLPVPLNKTLPCFLPFFLGGFLAADFYLSGLLKSAAWWGNALALAAVGSFFLISYLGERFGLLCPFVMMSILIAAFKGSIGRAILSSPLLTTIGGMCYTLYLFHQVIIDRIPLPRFGWDYAGYFLSYAAMMLPIIIALCSVYFILIERPCMQKDWPARLWSWFKEKRSLSCAEEVNSAID